MTFTSVLHSIPCYIPFHIPCLQAAMTEAGIEDQKCD